MFDFVGRFGVLVPFVGFELFSTNNSLVGLACWFRSLVPCWFRSLVGLACWFRSLV